MVFLNVVRARCAMMVNHRAIANSLRVVNLLPVVLLAWQGPLGLEVAQKINLVIFGGSGSGRASEFGCYLMLKNKIPSKHQFCQQCLEPRQRN